MDDSDSALSVAPRRAAPVTAAERWGLLAGAVVMIAGGITLAFTGWLWAVAPGGVVMAAVMAVRAWRSARVRDWENMAMGGWSAGLALLVVGATLTRRPSAWVWVAVSAVSLVGAAALGYQTQRDMRRLRAWSAGFEARIAQATKDEDPPAPPGLGRADEK